MGFGYDLHRLIGGRKLLLGGCTIPSQFGEAGHSDGDVLIHALIDAMLGAAAMDDIGRHFPPSDPAYRDISSMVLLEKTLAMIEKSGYSVVNVDCTVVLESPRIAPFIEKIRENLAGAIGTCSTSISVKGKTKEGVDAAGEGRAIEAYAVVLLEKNEK